MKKYLVLLAAILCNPAFAQYFPIPDGAIPVGNSRRSMSAYASNLTYNATTKQMTLTGVSGAVAPEYSFGGTGNNDNGMFRAGTDIVGFSTAGVERARFTAGATMVFTPASNNFTFGLNTTDGSDDSLMTFSGGATSSINRGALFQIYGNQHASKAGYIELTLGNISEAPSAQGVFYSNGLTKTFSWNQSSQVGIGNITPAVKLDVGGAMALRPQTFNLTSDGQAITLGDHSFIRLSSDNATPANRTFTIDNGLSDGEVIHLHVVANAAELADSGNVALSAAWTPDANDTLTLQWDATSTVWRELSRSAN